MFWPFVLNTGAEIDFCYEPFKWSNNATNNAGVYCTILGLSKRLSRKQRFIFFEAGRREVEHINPYLVDGQDVIVEGRASPLSNLSRINTGNQAADGGHLTLTSSEKEAIESRWPESSQFIRRVSGTSEFFDGSVRWCLWIDDHNLKAASEIPPIRERIEQVRHFRESAGEVAQALADKPHQFRYRNTPTHYGIIVPQVSAESREYIPSGLFGSSLVITHKAHAIFNPTLQDFSIFNSRMHFIWARALSGRLGNGLSYSSNLSWNTFPVPLLTEQNQIDLTRSAEAILLAREAHFPATIADLYDPATMPANLRAAHEHNDEVLERIYIGRRFKNDTERLEKLFSLYTQMTAAASKSTPAKKAARRIKA